MKIFYKNLTGKLIELDVDSFYTIGHIKGMIEDKQGIPAEQQCILYAGKLLEDNRTLLCILIVFKKDQLCIWC